MRKSRFLALFLTIVFVLANVTIPSFAAATFIHEGGPETVLVNVANGTYLAAPTGNHPLHISYAIDDEGATYSIGSTAGTYPARSDITISEDGLLDLLPIGNTGLAATTTNATASIQIVINSSEGTKVYDSSTTSPAQKILGLVRDYNYDFEDGTTPEDSDMHGLATNGPRFILRDTTTTKDTSTAQGTKGLKIVTENGRTYAKSTGSLTIYPFYALRKADNLKNQAPSVFEMELKDLSSSIAYPTDRNLIAISAGRLDATWANGAVTAGATKGVNYDALLENFDPAGWHKYKWIIKPAYTPISGTAITSNFDLYIDDQLFLKNVPVSTFNFSGGTGVAFSANGVDNLKGYGTSLGFAHDVSLTASNGNEVGSTLTASAYHAEMPISNIPETMEVGIYKADAVDGTYTKVSTGATYTLTEEDAGKFFKAGAIVKEDIHTCATLPVYSADYVEAGAAPQAPKADYNWKTRPSVNEKLIVWAPYGDDTYDIPFAYTGDTDEQAEFTVGGTGYTEGKVNVVQAAGAKSGVLSIGDIGKVTHGHVKTSGVESFTNNDPLSIDVFYSDEENEKDTIQVRQFKKNDFEDGNRGGYTTGASIANDGDSHGNYLRLTSESTLQLRHLLGDSTYQFKGVIAFDFDAKINNDFVLKIDNNNGSLDDVRIANFAAMPGYLYNHWNSSDAPVYVGEGWKPVRLLLDYNTAKYSCFVDGKPIVVNASMDNGITSDTKHGIRYLIIKGSIDNLGISNVTVKNPQIFNAAITNAAVGKALSADYDFYCGATDYVGSNTIVEYKILNDGTWETITTAPTAADLGKLVKAVITPKIVYNGETITGTAVETIPVRIGDISINNVTLKVNGVEKNIRDQVIAKTNTGNSLEELTVELTVNANATEEKAVQFVIAQYSYAQGKYILKAVKAQDATIGTTAANNVITFDAKELKGDTTLKLFMLTSDGLVPVNSVINLR